MSIMVAEMTNITHRSTGEAPEPVVIVKFLTDVFRQPGQIDLHRKGWALI